MRRTLHPVGRCLAPLAFILVLGLVGCEVAPGAENEPEVRERPVALVTGSTAGLGRALAIELGTRGMHVIVHGRDVERGREVVDMIREDGRGWATLELADFASLAEVRALAERVRADHDHLALLVNNAGVGPGSPGHERVLTQDGNELRFQVNYLAGFLLVRELLPLLEEGAPSRIVNVASRSQQPIDFDNLTFDEGYRGGVAYGRSKLAQILHAIDLAEALEGREVSVVAVHPAPAMDTGLVRETGGQPQSTVQDGLESVLRAATDQSLPTGSYLHETEISRAHEQAYDPDARQRLREISEQLVARALREPS